MASRRSVSRRAIFRAVAAAGCWPLLAEPRRAAGLALYTVRDALRENPDQVLKLAADIGYTEVEIVRNQLPLVARRLAPLGLNPVSLHFETPLITGNWQAWKDAEMPAVNERDTFERVIDECKAASIPNLVFNYLPPKERGELDYYRALADKLNEAAVKCLAAGLRLWYHNHNFEFARARGAAVPKFDIASVPDDTFQEIGAGDLDLTGILRTCSRSGVRYYFVEQDHSPDPLGAIRRSYAALRGFGF